MDRERTDYVFHRPRRARERHVVWLPIDLLARFGFFVGAAALVIGVIYGVSQFASRKPESENWFLYALAYCVTGTAILIIVNWLQRRGGPAPNDENVIRRQSK